MPEPLHDHGEVRQVLRYWLETLRLEQSLASRPRAVRPRAGDGPAQSPRSQTYFRLGGEHAAFMVEASGSAEVSIDDALVRFLEHWLARTRRRAAAARDAAADAQRTSWVIGWPALLLHQREEIATLFRFPVDMEWRAGGVRWEPLDRARPRQPGAPHPDALVVRAGEMAGEEGDPPPVSVDRNLLEHALGVADDEIDALERRWAAGSSPARMASDLLRLLAPDAAGGGEGADPAAIFARLIQAAQRRLPGGISVYPVGIVQDGELVFATYHLQAELSELCVRSGSERPLARGTALSSYLTGAPTPAGWAPLRGRFRPRGITASQRAAAERFLGSTLSSVQGPPGTGKTELILNLAAHAVVERIGAFVGGAPMTSGLLVVASTNNRAVDNAIDPLGRDFPIDRLPVALRTGNQEVTATRTARELERARDWLAGQDVAGAAERLAGARAGFRAASHAYGGLAAPEIARAARRQRLDQIGCELAALGPAAPAPAEESGWRAIGKLRGELVQLRQIAVSRRKGRLARLNMQWTRIAGTSFAAVAGERGEVAAALTDMLPPVLESSWTVGERLEAWQDAAQDAIELLESALPAGRGRARRDRQRRSRLESELAELEAAPEPAPLDAAGWRELESLGHALYLRALDVRERWAVANRQALIPSLDKAIQAATVQRSLRRRLAREGAARSALRALYPVLGCTLLSLGGCFELEADSIDELVIDEAGQCHPAFAVSGLARARRALLVGDVHQLPPVVSISRRDEARIRRDLPVRIAPERFEIFRVHDRSESSAQALADRATSDRPTLTDHFRCQPPIIGLCDQLCGYGLVVHTAPRSLAAQVPSLRAPLLFAAVDGEQVRVRGSWSNPAEAERLVALLLELGGAGVQWSEIGVMAPFVAQIELLRARLRAHRIPFEAASGDLAGGGDDGFDRAGGLSIGTVHRFQGGERSVVLFSAVVTDPSRLSFLDDRVNLINVAVSRARDHLVTFGSRDALRAGVRTRLLVEHATPM